MNNALIQNLHTHTVFSDGRNTPREVTGAAVEKGMTLLGFSDHSFTPHDPSYCMKENSIGEYKQTVKDLAEEFEGKIKILCGIELDAYSPKKLADELDYFIGASHYVTGGGVIYDVDHTKESSERAIKEGFGGDDIAFIRAYYDNLLSFIELKPLYIAHFDLPTKFGMFDGPSRRYISLSLEVLDAFLDADIPIEVNTGAIARKVRALPYPAPFLLDRIREKKGRVVLGSDCHNKDFLTCAFEDCSDLLSAHGLTPTPASALFNG